jgi:hypothetical protein
MLKELGLGSITERDCHIEKVNNAPPIMKRLEGREVNIDELNYLSKRLDDFKPDELATYSALAEAHDYRDITELINLCDSIQNALTITEFGDKTMIGIQYAMHKLDEDATIEEIERIDVLNEADELLNMPSKVTSYGVVYDLGFQLSNKYEGKNLPDYKQAGTLLDVNVIALKQPSAVQTFHLPESALYISRMLQRIGISNEDEYTLEVIDENAPLEIVSQLDYSKEKLSDLNNMTNEFRELFSRDEDMFRAVCLYAKPRSVEQMRTLAGNLELFEFVPGVHNAEEYGKYIIQDSGHFEYTPELEEYIDFARYGNDRIAWYKGQFTELGYIGYSGISSLDKLMGKEQTRELKLYMPLKADFIDNDRWEEYEDNYIELYGDELAEYEEQISQAIEANTRPEEKERGLMHWYRKADSLNEKVKSARFTVESRYGQLYGVAQCEVIGELNSAELKTLKDYITGQASDGWGEGFEQNEIEVDNGSIFVHLWDSGSGWFIQTEDELPEPEMGMKF